MSRNDRVHHLRDTYDRVDRANPGTEVTADAQALIYARDLVEAGIPEARE
jgi:hypothetical protein